MSLGGHAMTEVPENFHRIFITPNNGRGEITRNFFPSKFHEYFEIATTETFLTSILVASNISQNSHASAQYDFS